MTTSSKQIKIYFADVGLRVFQLSKAKLKKPVTYPQKPVDKSQNSYKIVKPEGLIRFPLISAICLTDPAQIAVSLQLIFNVSPALRKKVLSIA